MGVKTSFSEHYFIKMNFLNIDYFEMIKIISLKLPACVHYTSCEWTGFCECIALMYGIIKIHTRLPEAEGSELCVLPWAPGVESVMWASTAGWKCQ